MRDYQTKQNNPNVADTIVVDNFAAGEFNSISQELTNAVEKAGLTPAVAAGTSETFFQLGQAMAIMGGGGGSSYAASGSGSAFLLALHGTKTSLYPDDYFLGMECNFTSPYTNGGTATVNVGSMGVKDIRDSDGVALVGGEISVGMYVKLIYNGTYFELKGDGYFEGSSTNCAVQLNNGFILQYGYDATANDGGAISLPITYPNAHVAALANVNNGSTASTTWLAKARPFSTSSIILYVSTDPSPVTWVSIGY